MRNDAVTRYMRARHLHSLQGMINRMLLLLFALAMPGMAGATQVTAPLIITVSLSKHSVTIQKNTRKSRSVLTAWIIPIAPGTIRPGHYKLLRMKERYRSQGGNVELENVIRTDGNFNLRTTRMFKDWMESGRPAQHTIVMDAETGSLLYTTINHYGLQKTLLRVIP
jgi:hypothetical protein